MNRKHIEKTTNYYHLDNQGDDFKMKIYAGVIVSIFIFSILFALYSLYKIVCKC